MRRQILGPCTIVRVQSWDAAASAPPAIDHVVGAAWPREVGAVAQGVADVLCVGPTDWLVIRPGPVGGELYDNLRTALLETTLRPTEVSQSLTRVELEGPEVREFMAKGCSLDLHPDLFPPGRCARTRFAGIPTILRCHAPLRFEAVVTASLRQYLLAWLDDALA